MNPFRQHVPLLVDYMAQCEVPLIFKENKKEELNYKIKIVQNHTKTDFTENFIFFMINDMRQRSEWRRRLQSCNKSTFFWVKSQVRMSRVKSESSRFLVRVQVFVARVRIRVPSSGNFSASLHGIFHNTINNIIDLYIIIIIIIIITLSTEVSERSNFWLVPYWREFLGVSGSRTWSDTPFANT